MHEEDLVMTSKIVILTASTKHSLIKEYSEWQKNNPKAINVVIHYSHAIACRMDRIADESYSILIEFGEQEILQVG